MKTRITVEMEVSDDAIEYEKRPLSIGDTLDRILRFEITDNKYKLEKYPNLTYLGVTGIEAVK